MCNEGSRCNGRLDSLIINKKMKKESILLHEMGETPCDKELGDSKTGKLQISLVTSHPFAMLLVENPKTSNSN
jgi:hypothetical protein